jgi:hypothetical protein
VSFMVLTSGDSAARNDLKSSAAQRYCCSSPCFFIEVGTSILESPGLHAQVARYKMMNDLSDEKISSNQMGRLCVVIS